MNSTRYRDDPVAALFSIPTPLDYLPWVRILTAFKAAGGSEFAAREWSESGEGYNERVFRTTWRSIRAEGGITARTLYWIAGANGYRSERV
ncbi:PriCT-2 domain-containing protein [Paraburkholderia sp. J7]|uniref:PriCT-2 domain-containing protein n=1 Tax=Paraburkholderia sp. J7 TaxID=2805438 RepID=UPI002AB6317D|nr:PriCT-2 domain-containing protein [Paraburkholderia sp. J7]